MLDTVISIFLLILANVLAVTCMIADVIEPWAIGAATFLRHCSELVETALDEYKHVAESSGKSTSLDVTSQKKPAYPSERNVEKSPQKPRPCPEEKARMPDLERKCNSLLSHVKNKKSGNFVSTIQNLVEKFINKTEERKEQRSLENAGCLNSDTAASTNHGTNNKARMPKKRGSPTKGKKKYSTYLSGSIDETIVARVVQYREKEVDVPKAVNMRIQGMMHYNVPLKPFEATIVLPPPRPPVPPPIRIDSEPSFVMNEREAFLSHGAQPLPWLLSLIPTPAIERIESLVEEILVHIEDRLGRETAEIVQATIRDTTLKFLSAQETWMQRNETLSVADVGLLPALTIPEMPGMLPNLPIPDALPQSLRVFFSPFGFLIATMQNGTSLKSRESVLSLSSSCDNMSAISACTPQSLPGSPRLRKKVLGNFHNISDDTLYRARDKLRYEIDESMKERDALSVHSSSNSIEIEQKLTDDTKGEGSGTWDREDDHDRNLRADPRLGIFNPQESHVDIVQSCGNHCVTKVNGAQFRSVRSALPLRIHPNENDWTFVEIAVDSLNASSMHTINRHAHRSSPEKGSSFLEQKWNSERPGGEIRRSISYEGNSQFLPNPKLPRCGSFHSIQPCNIALGLSTLDMPLNTLCGSWPDSLAFTSTGYFSQNSSFTQLALSTTDWAPVLCGFSFGDRPALLVKVIPIFATNSQRSSPMRSPGLSLSREHSDADLTVDVEDDRSSVMESLHSSCEDDHDLIELMVLVKLVVNGHVVPISHDSDQSVEVDNSLEFR
jgi:hypothetical protein